SQNALSPKFGLVYQVIPSKISLFANYMNGFRNLAPVVQPLPDIDGTFKPQQANQFESGVKMELFNRKLFLTASYYNIHVANITRPESVEREGTVYNITVQNG
ncbi:TonB-dependent receptor, partial [Flavihumibacter sediminis]|nr:TonB-dependent receptor [Flavihumibacter sediminis]